MRVTCPSCQASYNIDEKRIPPGGAKLKCSKCQTLVPLRAPEPPPPVSRGLALDEGAVPLPGLGGPGGAGAHAVGGPPVPATGPGRVLAGAPASPTTGVIPLPSLGLAVPGLAPPAFPRLTPAAPQGEGAAQSLTTGAIALPPSTPVPGPAPTTAFPAGPTRGRSDRTVAFPMPAAPRGDDGAVPLPRPAAGAFAPPPLPNADWAPPARARTGTSGPDAATGAVPLPMPARPAFAPSAVTGADAAGFDPFSGIEPPPDAPLPGDEAFSFGEDVSRPVVPTHPSVAEHLQLARELEDETGAAAPSADGGWGSADGTAPVDDSPFGQGWSADGEADPTSDVGGPGGHDGARGPREAAPSTSFGEVDLEPLPIPADEPAPSGDAYAWSEPLPADATDAADEARDAPALDLSDLPPVRGLGGAPQRADPLEYDPTAPQEEDLEADLASPLPAAIRPPEDGLEVLGFLDDAAREAKARPGRITRYHVRRRSGKVFGPFEPGVIAKMLEDGQLLGNEEVSVDAETWTGLSAVPAFSEVMQRLVAGPAPSATPMPGAVSAVARPKLDMEQLAQAYGGRMAVVQVVDGEAKARRRKRLAVLGAAGLVVLALFVAGASLGFTRYGPFGFRWLFPARVSTGSPEGAALADARTGLAEDTWPGLKRARGKLEALLSRREFTEVRAVWCASVFGEQRRWGTAAPDQVAKARSAMDDIQLLGKSDADRVKAEAGLALLDRKPDAALAALKTTRGDADTALLESEALVQKAQPAQAADVLERSVKAAPSARTWHALGVLRASMGKAEAADAAFAQALQLAPTHLGSAVERGVLALDRSDAAAALSLVEPALADEKALARPERARGLAVKGGALLASNRAVDAVPLLEEAVKLDASSVLAKGTLARALSAQRQDERALPLWAEAVSKEPKTAAWTIGQLQSMLALHKNDELLATVKKASPALQKNARVLLLQGRAQEQLERLIDADASYRAALEASPQDVDAALALARLQLRSRRTSEARTVLASLVEKLPREPRLHVGLGDVALASGDAAGAQAEYEKATALAPDLADGWVARARVAGERKAWKEARDDAEKALALDATSPEAKLEHGVALWRLGELEPATAELQAAVTGLPGNARALVSLAGAKFDQGDLDGAAAALGQVLKTEPGNPDANFWMARVNDKKGQFTSALESMRAALDRAPSRAAFHHEMGLILRDAQKGSDAIEAWKNAVKLDPGYADPWEALGQAYLDRGRYKEAIAAFEACLKADPSRARVLGSLGDCHAQAGKWQAAIATYQQALGKDASLTKLYYRIGLAYGELGQHDKAVGWYQKAVGAEPDNALAYYHLGYSLKERGNKRDAIAAFQKYLARAPDAKDRKDIEDEIYYLGR